MSIEIDQTHTNAVSATLSNRPNPISVQGSMLVEVVANPIVESKLKPSLNTQLNYFSSISTASSSTISYHCASGSNNHKKLRQTKLWSGKPYPQACEYTNDALADFIHSNIFPFTFEEYTKLQKFIDITKRLPSH